MEEERESEELFSEEFLRKLERIKILSRKGIKGPTRGEHAASRSGTSLDFLDYRKYQVGDDFRYVDWNVYGRSDKLFLKLFKSEEDLSIHVLLDASRSMGEGSPSKFFYAKRLAAALSYIGLSNLDRVGLAAFRQKLGEVYTPQRGQKSYAHLIRFLKGMPVEDETDISTSLTEYAETCKRPGVAIILSDLLDPKGIKPGLESLLIRKFDIILFHILEHEELSPSVKGYFILEEVETHETRKMNLDSSLIRLYHDRLEMYLKDIREFCYNRGINYYLCDTSVPVEDFLIQYLSQGTVFTT
jgi:uncharacterized protein (DUF58 family)